ncbi:MAG: hypothetical protein Q9177_005801, partial [Variospora cf. flavescens]
YPITKSGSKSAIDPNQLWREASSGRTRSLRGLYSRRDEPEASVIARALAQGRGFGRSYNIGMLRVLKYQGNGMWIELFKTSPKCRGILVRRRVRLESAVDPDLTGGQQEACGDISKTPATARQPLLDSCYFRRRTRPACPSGLRKMQKRVAEMSKAQVKAQTGYQHWEERLERRREGLVSTVGSLSRMLQRCSVKRWIST